MVKLAKRQEINRNDQSPQQESTHQCGAINSAFVAYLRAFTVRPISSSILYANIITLFLFWTILLGLHSICYFLSVQFISFSKEIQFSAIFYRMFIGFSIYVVVTLLLAFLFSLWSKKSFSSLLILIFASSCCYAPICVLCRFIPIFGYLLEFFCVIVMSYYVDSSLSTIYAPRDQREGVIQSAIGFLGTLGLYMSLMI